MTRWILILCIGSLFFWKSAWFAKTLGVEANDNDDDYLEEDVNNDESQGSNPSQVSRSNETRSPGRDGKLANQRPKKIWKVIRRELRDVKNLLPTLTGNISGMETDVRDMNKHFFSMAGDLKFIKNDMQHIKRQSHAIWQNLTEQRRNNKELGELLRHFMQNSSLMADDIHGAVKNMKALSIQIGNMITNPFDSSEIFGAIKTEFSEIKNTVTVGNKRLKSEINKVHQAVDHVTDVWQGIQDIKTNLKLIEYGLSGLASNRLQNNSTQADFVNQVSGLIEIMTGVSEISKTLADHHEGLIEIWKHTHQTVNELTDIKSDLNKVGQLVNQIGLNATQASKRYDTHIVELGHNVGTIGSQIAAFAENVNHNFDRANVHLGDVQDRILSNVTSIKYDLDEMKGHLRQIRQVIGASIEGGQVPITGSDHYYPPHPPASSTSYPPYPQPPDHPPVYPPRPGYPPYPVYPPPTMYPPAPGNPPYPDYPTSTMYPPVPGYPPPPDYPTSTMYPPVSGYPPSTTDHYPHITTFYPTGYPPTTYYPIYPTPTVYPPGYPVYPPTTYYPPPGYPTTDKDDSRAPTSPSPPSTIPKLPLGPEGPGLPIGCAEQFTNQCLCSCPCRCNHEGGVYTGQYFSSQNIQTHFPTDCNCLCVCPCPKSPVIEPIIPGDNRPVEPPFEPPPPPIPIDLPATSYRPTESPEQPPKTTLQPTPSQNPTTDLPWCGTCCSAFTKVETFVAHLMKAIERSQLKIVETINKKFADLILLKDMLNQFLLWGFDPTEKVAQAASTLQALAQEIASYQQVLFKVDPNTFNGHQSWLSSSGQVPDVRPPDFSPPGRPPANEPSRPQGPPVGRPQLIKPEYPQLAGHLGWVQPPHQHGQPAALPASQQWHVPFWPNTTPGLPPSAPGIQLWPSQNTPHRQPTSAPEIPSWASSSGSSKGEQLDSQGQPLWQPPPVISHEFYPPSPKSRGTSNQPSEIPTQQYQRQFGASIPNRSSTSLKSSVGVKTRAGRKHMHEKSTTTNSPDNTTSPDELEVAWRSLPNDNKTDQITETSEKAPEEKMKKSKKKCKDTSELHSVRVNAEKVFPFPKEDKSDFEEYDNTSQGNTNDVELLPNEVMQIPDTEVALPDHHLRTLQTPVDPIAFHKILQKHINNQIIKTIKSDPPHRLKKKRDPFGRRRPRKRYRLVPHPIFPKIPGFPLIQHPVRLPPQIPQIPHIPALNLRNPLIPAIVPPIVPNPLVPPQISDILGSLPPEAAISKINGSPYSVSYNDGRGNSWNVNINRRNSKISDINDDNWKESDERVDDQDEKDVEQAVEKPKVEGSDVEELELEKPDAEEPDVEESDAEEPDIEEPDEVENEIEDDDVEDKDSTQEP